VVRDEWQRLGVGIALATRVQHAAEARGFDRFVAHVLSENLAMRKVLTHVGRIVSMKTRHGVCEVSFVQPAGPGIVRV
jgi:RimJ/RimL family protein N-acetyltransferase